MTEKRGRPGRKRGMIRRLEPRDRQAVRDICCRTAFRNMGSDRFFEDRELHADYWTAFYTDHHPHESWVVEQNGRVIGYFFGCSDHARFHRVMSRRIVPRVLVKALWRLATGRYRKPETRRYLWHQISRGPREAPGMDFRKYPAHYHCNILREGYGQRYYTELVLMFLDHLESIGVTHLHGFITEPADTGGWQKFVDRFDAPFNITREVPSTLFRAVVGDTRPMVNRAWGMPVAGYRDWIIWLRDKYKI